MTHQRTPAWLWAVPVFSCGLLSAAPPFAIALKRGTSQAWSWSIGFAAATVLSLVLIGSQPEGADNVWTGLGATIVLVMLVASPIYSVMAAREMGWGSPAAPAAPYPGPMAPPYVPDGNAGAVAAAQLARQRRAEAMQLAANDPQMARELRIGRPDLPRRYDDGGLVDLNSAPEATLVRWLGVTPEQATAIVAARHDLGRFQHPDDLLQLGGLDLETYDRCKDRILLL